MSKLVLTQKELEDVKRKLRNNDWYRNIFKGFKERVDRFIKEKPEIPVEKSRVFYESCPDDNTRLKFDPYNPGQHICPRCGKNWTGDKYYRAWVRFLHEWIQKRVIEAGILFQVLGEEDYASSVHRVLKHYAIHYQDYPLANNLLGPTRLFQSTYLEAFWLTDMVIAYDLVRDSKIFDHQDHQMIKDLFYQSTAIIKSFNEGKSNRQAFNNTGMGAVGLLYNDRELIDYVLSGPAGFSFHMQESLLEDGLWYEGENYHFATLDHLLNLAELARHRNIDLYHGRSGYGSLQPMFEGPLRVMYPDLTFPSRKDSWFGRGINFHKEIYELGYTRYNNPVYGGLLNRAYQEEGNREELGWRAFLYCKEELPDLDIDQLRPEESEKMPGTGVAVLRREKGQVYVSIEYGHYGGGHGHPDRLHLNLYDQEKLWFLDPGTGWYHVPELSWYRSTLAHNTVVVDGISQNPAEGHLLTFGDTDSFQISQAMVNDIYPGISMCRTLCLAEDYLFDIFDVYSAQEHTYDFVLHSRASLNIKNGKPFPENLTATTGKRNGYQFLKDVTGYKTDPTLASFTDGDAALKLWQPGENTIYTARSIGVPLQDDNFNILINRKIGKNTRFVSCYFRKTAPAGSSIKKLSEGRYIIQIGSEKHLIQCGFKQEGLAVAVKRNDKLQRIDWFGVKDINLAGIKIRNDYKLEQAYIYRNQKLWNVNLPDGFGQIEITGPDIENIIKDLPAEASYQISNNEIMLTQPPGSRIIMADENKIIDLYAGCKNHFNFKIFSYQQKQKGKPTLRLPASWRLISLDNVRTDGNCQEWKAVIQVPGKQGSKNHSISINTGENKENFSVNIKPPVTVEWDIKSTAERPVTELKIKELRGQDVKVKGKISTPWLKQDYKFEIELPAAGQEQVLIPIPLSLTLIMNDKEQRGVNDANRLIEKDNDLYWKLAGDENTAGHYQLTTILQLEEFQGYSRAKLPIYWSSFKGKNKSTQEIVLDKPEQACWAEFPYQGAEDCSARARIQWDKKGLYLEAMVIDDIHVTDANQDDLYENDSLQIYFDFRDNNIKTADYTPGVAAYVLAPDSTKKNITVQAIAGNKEISNRDNSVEWFTTEGLKTAIQPRDDGYHLQVFFPYRSLGVEPLKPGAVIGFDLALSDNDGTWYRKLQLMWSGARGRRCYIRGSYHNPCLFGHLITVSKG